MQMDPVLGEPRSSAWGTTRLLIVMSDHGFAPWHRKFSLNTWLVENGYLVLQGRRQDQGAAGLAAKTSDLHRCTICRGRLVEDARLRDGLQRPLPQPGRARARQPGHGGGRESGIVQPGAEARRAAQRDQAAARGLRRPEERLARSSSARTSRRTSTPASASARSARHPRRLRRRLRQLGRLLDRDASRTPCCRTTRRHLQRQPPDGARRGLRVP